jgi:uncharacterized protein YdiU (UPF0061 family)
MRILEKIGQIERGEIAAGDVPGSTTERLAIGLAINALDKTNPDFAGDEKGAWERLDASQRSIVREINPEYRKRKWRTAEDIERARLERDWQKNKHRYSRLLGERA